MFFQMSGGGYAASRNNNNPNNHNNSAASNNSFPPRFRGLIWVVCEEDLDDYVNTNSAAAARVVLEGHTTHSNPEKYPNSNSMDLEEELDDDFYSSEDDDDDDDDEEEYGIECAMETDTPPDFGGVVVAMDVDVDVVDGENDEGASNNLELELRKVGVVDTHMHPVHHRGALSSPLSSQVTPTSSPAIDIKTPSSSPSLTISTTTTATQAVQIPPSTRRPTSTSRTRPPPVQCFLPRLCGILYQHGYGYGYRRCVDVDERYFFCTGQWVYAVFPVGWFAVAVFESDSGSGPGTDSNSGFPRPFPYPSSSSTTTKDEDQEETTNRPPTPPPPNKHIPP